LEQRK
jgi:ATP synthase delta (OSCP) subunit.